MDDIQLRGWLNSCLMELGAAYDKWAFHKGDPDEFTTIMNLIKDLWDEQRSRIVT